MSSRLLRIGRCAGISAVLMFAAHDSLQTAIADSDTRTLSFHNTHTGEDLTVTFKRNGRYDEAALKRLNWYMRDWRREEEIKMDPQLFDLLWEAYRESGATRPIEVICGYRSPETNSMLRARSSGVAQGSLHTHGQAMDFFIPGVPLEKIREVGLKMQRGGVGFYPTSGSPFVHLDTGSIRHWPRMTRDQLVKVFPNERTVHIPSDGQPLAGYALAMADVERQGRTPSNVSLAAARSTGVLDDETTASVKPSKPKPTLLASFFGFKSGAPEPEKKAVPLPAPVVTASLTAPTPLAVERIVPMPKGRPAMIEAPVQVASLTPMPSPRPAAAKPAAAVVAQTNLFDDRGLWPAAEPTPADRITTASIAPALAYAPAAEPRKVQAAAPMGAAGRTPAAVKFSAQIGARFDDPWMRMVMLAPSARGFMTASQFGGRDMRGLREQFRKPASSVTMAFSDDPHGGLVSNAFSGSAVVFVATTHFGMKTAQLQP